ncbi:hypothetical protein [Peijinzhouia sedimentorum]
MNSTVRNILAVIIGLVVGSGFNGAIISVGGNIIPTPAGSDTSTMEGLQAAMEFFELQHFLFPFLAHAIGTFAGALVAGVVASSHQMIMSLIIGGFFLMGGIYMVAVLPSPLWFTLVDLLIAYIPMSYLAGRLATKNKVA